MKKAAESKTVAVIGGGPAGMECSWQLKQLGHNPVIVEKADKLGGHLNNWDKLFPDTTDSADILKELNKKVKDIKAFTKAEISEVSHEKGQYCLKINGKDTICADSIVISTGFDLFKAEKKEEYGYGIYNHVITNADLESYFKTGDKSVVNNPSNIGFVHCVGSRDEKVFNRHCSKVCCVTAVKQAIELKQKFPESNIYCFYMDLRMFGRGYEDLYFEAQTKYGIRFIRGRVSEVSENLDCKVIVKAEDTLISKPIKVTLDLLVLMAGMANSEKATDLADKFNLHIAEDGFFNIVDKTCANNKSNRNGIFYAGTSTGPKTIPETLNDARSTALQVHTYLTEK